MTAMTITFTRAADAGACAPSVRRMAQHLGGIDTYGRDTPIPLTVVLDVLGVEDTIWALGALGEHRTCVAFACDCAERVLRHVPAGDRRPHEAIRVTRLWLAGLAADDAYAAAYAADDAAYAAAASAAAYAYAADDAAYAAAASAAAAAAAEAAAYAAYAAAYADDDAAAEAAAYAASAAAAAVAAADASEREREWQATRLRQYLTGEVTA